jgi:YD repeat-containing protein
MNSYVYDEWDNLVAVLDANNIATRYTYDEAGRLKKVEREFADDSNGVGGFKKLKSSEYHYAREIE